MRHEGVRDNEFELEVAPLAKECTLLVCTPRGGHLWGQTTVEKLHPILDPAKLLEVLIRIAHAAFDTDGALVSFGVINRLALDTRVTTHARRGSIPWSSIARV